MELAIKAFLTACAIAGLGFFGAPSAADAQAAIRAEQARLFFEEAMQELERGHLPEACDLFRQSLEFHPSPAAAFNLAAALQRAGEIRDAVSVLSELLEGQYGPLRGKRRAEAVALRNELRNELPTVRITVTGAPDAQVLVDGQKKGAFEGRPLRLSLDAGAHVIAARTPSGEAVERPVYLTKGERTDVELSLIDAAGGGSPSTDSSAASDVFSSPWFWVTAVAVAGTATAVLLAALSAPRRFPAEGSDDTPFGPSPSPRGM